MFCAPGWLHNAAAETALRRTGFRYLLDMFALCDLLTQRRIWAPAVGYMGAAAGQELGVQALNEIVQRTALRSATVASVYLHPQRHPTGSSVQRRLADLEVMVRRDGWRTATYAEVCDDDGASDASDASDADDARASAP
jgi:predicted deacetylase